MIEATLQHCGLYQSATPRAPPEVDNLGVELDPAYSESCLDPPDQADQSQDLNGLTYAEIDTFLASF